MKCIERMAQIKCSPVACAVAVVIFVSSTGFAQSAQGLRRQISERQSDITSLRHQIDQLKSSNSGLQNQITDLQNKLKSLEDQQRSLRDKRSQLKTSVTNLKGASAAEAPDAISSLGLKDLTESNTSAKPPAKRKKSGSTKDELHAHAKPDHHHHSRHVYHEGENQGLIPH